MVDLLHIDHGAMFRPWLARSGAFVHRLCRGEDREEVKPGEMKRTGAPVGPIGAPWELKCGIKTAEPWRLTHFVGIC